MKITDSKDLSLKDFLDQVRSGERPDVYTAETVIASRAATVAVAEFTPAIVADLSYYNHPISTETFKRIGGDYVIVKATMGYGTDRMLDTHVGNLKAAGIPFGLYHWFDPTASADQQLRLLEMAVNKHHPGSVWIDVEQCWSNWGSYWQYLDRQIPWADVPKYSPDSLLTLTRKFMDKAYARFPYSPTLGIYTGKWFIDSYCQGLPRLMKNYYAWLAQYNNAYRGIADDQRVAEIVRDAMTWATILPNGLDNCLLRQITSGIVIPGLVAGAPIDFNVSSCDQESLALMGGEEQIEPPSTSWKVKITPWNGLRIRRGPGITHDSIGSLTRGTVVDVCEEVDGWLRLAGRVGWISKFYTKAA